MDSTDGEDNGNEEKRNGVSKCTDTGNYDIVSEQQEIVHLEFGIKSGQKSNGKASTCLCILPREQLQISLCTQAKHF